MRNARWRRLPLPLLLIAAFALGGCGDQRILERIGFIQSTSYDLMPNGELKIAVAIPRLEAESNEKREVLSTTAPTSKQARIKMSRETSLQLVSGQLRVTLLGRSFAEAGIGNQLDTQIRDPAISPLMKIAVVNGDAEQLLNQRYSQHPRTDRYIERILEKEAGTHAIPKATLHQFVRDYYDDGIDPVAPMIRKAGKNIVIDGIALFRDDRFVYRLPPQDAMIFAFMRSRFKQGEIGINLQHQGAPREAVMVTSLVSQRSVKVSGSGPGTTVTVRVALDGTVLEYVGGLKLGKPKDLRKLERKIEAYVSGQAEAMMKNMQRAGADGIGIGAYVRNSMSYADWKRTNWRELYSQIDVRCKVKMTIKNVGKMK
ncbi:Ger(x)C family spore germination protein [Paenibacillus glycinis]|uniref:Ger(X)C family spore germination protein n=1 Tax=Paenibacillus glycinis TaxID=2697035 RepID=A0ABW9XYD6_9BACL|nr:Ger(x)C family spore germination protein [Paenibacillus glycinis]NBD27531.1 Ger(x)C family spore germination protein [Paenibacillus glycinis]